MMSPPLVGTQRGPRPAPCMVLMWPVPTCHRERTPGSAAHDFTPLSPDGLGSGEDKAGWPFILGSETRCPPTSKTFPRYMARASPPGIPQYHPQGYWG